MDSVSSELTLREFACKYVDMIDQRTGLPARFDLQTKTPRGTRWSVSAEPPANEGGRCFATADDFIQWVTNQAHHLESAHVRVRAMPSSGNIPYDVFKVATDQSLLDQSEGDDSSQLAMTSRSLLEALLVMTDKMINFSQVGMNDRAEAAKAYNKLFEIQQEYSMAERDRILKEAELESSDRKIELARETIQSLGPSLAARLAPRGSAEEGSVILEQLRGVRDSMSPDDVELITQCSPELQERVFKLLSLVHEPDGGEK